MDLAGRSSGGSGAGGGVEEAREDVGKGAHGFTPPRRVVWGVLSCWEDFTMYPLETLKFLLLLL